MNVRDRLRAWLGIPIAAGMRFWQKVFLWSLALLIIAISLIELVILTQSLHQNLNQARTDSLRVHELFLISAQTGLLQERYTAGAEVNSRERVRSTFSRLAETFTMSGMPAWSDDTVHGFRVQLYEGAQTIYSNLPFLRNDDLAEQRNLEENARNTMFLEYEQNMWLLIASKVELERHPYVLVTAHDVQAIYDNFHGLLRRYADLMLIVASAVAMLLLLLVYLLTRPIAALRTGTRRIASGDYDQRLAIHGADEFAELSHDFNGMAAAVSENIRALERMNEDRSRFIDNLTHEIKTPLTSIIGFSDLMRRGKTLPDPVRIQQAEYIYQEGKHLEQISRLLMELILLGKTRFELEPVAVSEMIEDRRQKYAPILEQKGIRLQTESSEDRILANRDLIHSLLGNLIDNALKASQEGTTIALTSAAGADGRVVVEVCDQGSGIPPEEIEKIRQPFYMLDKARTRKAGGAGLGLALCEAIARVHGADFTIESQVGVGTQIRVVFPEVIDEA